jgi:hypothetical protein
MEISRPDNPLHSILSAVDDSNCKITGPEKRKILKAKPNVLHDLSSRYNDSLFTTNIMGFDHVNIGGCKRTRS